MKLASAADGMMVKACRCPAYLHTTRGGQGRRVGG